MDLALNNLQKKIQPTNQPTNHYINILFSIIDFDDWFLMINIDY